MTAAQLPRALANSRIRRYAVATLDHYGEGGEKRILCLAASIATDIPIGPNHALSDLDQTSIGLITRPVRHTNGTRPGDCPRLAIR